MSFTVYPAIDIRGGACVRLHQGDYDKEEIYNSDPVKVAMDFKACGAKYLHVIDLDGAKAAKPVNLEIVLNIVKQTGLPVQLGGGIRDFENAKKILDSGVQRIILGSSVLKNPEFVKQALSEFADRVCIGMDCRNGRIAVEGWLEDSDVLATDLAEELKKHGLARVNYTDIARDGTLAGPNTVELKNFAETSQIKTIASGGVASIEDVDELSQLSDFVDGVIVGKALYTGNINPEELLCKY